MSCVYVARQPIFDRKLKLFGYELLYRKSENNYYEGTDDDQDTAVLIGNTLFMGFDDLIDGTRGFVNFSERLILDEIPAILPPDKVVVEILERALVTDEVVTACRKLKEKGYILALDDFICNDARNVSGLLDYIDIVKIDYNNMTIPAQEALIGQHGNRFVFLAEKVETKEEYLRAVRMGYSLFQGYFFSKPVLMQAQEIGSIADNTVLILEELSKEEPDYKYIAGIFEGDIDMSYKLLRMVNSAFYGVKYPVFSIQQALVHLGTQELKRWVYLMLLKGIQNADNMELVKTSLVRGKVLSLLSMQTRKWQYESDYFITGIFSSIDVLLHDTMENVVGRLPLSGEVKDALLGKKNDLRRMLDAVLDFERARWDALDALMAASGLPGETFKDLYLEAISWQRAISA